MVSERNATLMYENFTGDKCVHSLTRGKGACSPYPTLSMVVPATAASAMGSEEPRLRAWKERWEKLVRRASSRVTTKPNS